MRALRSLLLAATCVVLTACVAATLQPNLRLFSSMEDALVRPCNVPARDSLPCRLSGTRPLHDLELIAATSTYQAQGDTLIFAVAAPAVTYVRVLGGIQLPLERIAGTDIWTASIYVPHIDDVRIGYRFMTDTMRTVPVRYEFRGSNVRKRPLRSAQLHGTLRIDTLWSDALRESREVISYVPPIAQSEPYDVVYAADGTSVGELAELVDTLIANGQLRPLVLVGVRAAQPQPGDSSTRYVRAREYVYGFGGDSTRFLAHEQFFVNEVPRWAERMLHVGSAREARMIWGASNGGAFAITMGMRHPQVYSRVFASSPIYNVIPARNGSGHLPEFFVTVGTFEETTRARTISFVQQLKRLHAQTRFEVLAGGHDDLLWSEAFINALQATVAAEAQ